MLKVIETALDDLKAQDISVINLSGKASFADYLVIATGTSARHVASLADNVAKNVLKHGFGVAKTEGDAGSEWVCLDVGDIVVHVFTPASRQLYQLEKLWSFPAG
jgi:ribosome-associated protein